jgi:hypothetical protein
VSLRLPVQELKNPSCIVERVECFEVGGVHYIVMERLDRTLAEHMHENAGVALMADERLVTLRKVCQCGCMT